jgi:hypothetical protein
MVLSIIFLEDKHKIVLYLSIFYDLNRKSSPGKITHARDFPTLHSLVGVASEARLEKIQKSIEFLILKEI